MGGNGYLKVAGKFDFSVPDSAKAKAYKALSDAVENRTYNFGELRLDKNNRLEIINNHKNTFFHSNNTITTAEENQRARAAAFAILDAKYKGAVDADTLALVRDFLCGDKAIADQPLTRDEVANMIKLLKMPKGTVSKDSALEFLKTSYEFKHGLLDGALAPGLNSFARAEENRVSENVRSATLKLQKAQQKAALFDKLVKSPDGQPLSDGQILKNVCRFVITRPSASPSARYVALKLDPSTLEKVDDVKDYFLKAAVKFTKGRICATPNGKAFFSNMVTQYRASLLSKLGGDEQAVRSCLFGNSGSVSIRMMDLAFAHMKEDSQWWQQFAADCFKDKADIVKEGVGVRLKDDVANLIAQPNVKPELQKKTFSGIAETFRLAGCEDFSFQDAWQNGLTKVLSAYRYSGGDLVKTQAALADLKALVGESIKTLKGEMPQGMQWPSECRPVDNPLVKRAYMREDAKALVGFLEGLLKDENAGHAKHLLNYLSFSYCFENRATAAEQVESSMVESWMRSSNTDINAFGGDGPIVQSLKTHFETNVAQKLKQLKESHAVSDLDGLIDECATQVDDFAGQMFGRLEFRGKNSSPLYKAVSNGSHSLVLAYRNHSVDELVAASDFKDRPPQDRQALKTALANDRRTQFADLRNEFFGYPTESEQKMAKEKESAIAKDVSSLEKESMPRLKRLAAVFKDFPVSKHESVDRTMYGLIQAQMMTELPGAQAAVITELEEIQADKNKGVMDADKIDIVSAARLLIESTPSANSDRAATVGGQEHLLVSLSEVIEAFSQADSAKVNGRILGAVQERCEKDFGMSQEDVRLFVDPAVVAIVAKSVANGEFEKNDKVLTETQLDRIMQCAITKAKKVLESKDKNISGDDKNRAQAFLWKMQESVKAARGQLAAFWPLVRELDPGVSNSNLEQKLSNIIINQNNGGSEGKRLIGDIGRLLVNSSGKEAKYTYKDTTTTSILGIKRNHTLEYGITSNMSDTANYERIDRSRGFWRGMNTFLNRLDRLQATIAKCDVKVGEPEGEIGEASREFVNKVRARFGGAPFIRDEKVDENDENSIKIKKVDKERFKDFVNVDGSKDDLLRTNYSLSFVF